MKKYLPLILLALVSCKGFLEEVPTTSLSEKDVYDSPQALEANINGCYLTLNNSSLWKGTMYEYFQTGSGLIIWSGNRTTDEVLHRHHRQQECLDRRLAGNQPMQPPD